MTNVANTNRFFTEKVYPSLATFAFLPISWAFESKNPGLTGLVEKLLLAAWLSPLLVPATIVTFTIAVSLARIAAVIHGLSFLVAKIADACSKQDDIQLTSLHVPA